jgi:integrase
MRKQNGQIIRIGDRWYVRYWERRNTRGSVERKRVTHFIGPVTTRGKRPPADIGAEAERHMATVNSSSIPAERIVTVGNFAEQIFLPWVDRYKRPSTAHSYHQLWRQHLAPQCSDAWLNKISTFDVQTWLDKIATTSARPLSVSTLRHCKFTLSGLFRLAAQQGYRTGGNPVEGASISPFATRPRQTHAYSTEEISQMLIVLDEPARTIVGVCAFTALRIGEVEGLQWEDYRGGCFHVSRSIWHGRANAPKTEESAAPVPVIPQLVAMVEMHRARSGFPSSGPIFRTSNSTRLGMGNVLNRQVLAVLNRCSVCKLPKGKRHAGSDHNWQPDTTLPRWRGWHAFRRAVATNLQHLGANVITAQGALRHSDASVTLRHYSKVVRDDVRVMMEKLGNAVDLPRGNALQDSERTPNPLLGGLPEPIN